MKTRLLSTEEQCRQTAEERADTGEAHPAPGHRSGPCDRDLGWRSATAADPADKRRDSPPPNPSQAGT